MINAPKCHAIVSLIEQPTVLNVFTSPLNLDRNNKKKIVCPLYSNNPYKQFGHCLEMFTL